ncbi:MAG: hypothetical protein K9J06_11955 [Flavobacteriales bacterium]|nr:hypothetical protein [Flavobacteriales bacterium]
MNNMRISILGLLAAVFILSGCGNIDIVKRRHMPGYHVEVNKKAKQEKAGKNNAQVALAEQDMESMDPKSAALPSPSIEDGDLTASVAPVSPEVLRAARKAHRKAAIDNAVDKTMTTFRHELAATKGALKPSPAGDTHWMAWVAFGAGIGAAFFGFIGVILAIFGFALWVPAIVFGVTAIVFAIIHAKKGYGGEKFRRLGLLFGIIGASLGMIGLIIWAIRIARVFVV